MPAKNGRIRGATSELISAARELRSEQTLAEAVLWEVLRGRKLEGFKFRQQYPVGQYILDFVCAEHKLIIELDGKHHNFGEQFSLDQERSAHLERFGCRIVRFPNAAVFDDLDGVLNRIRVELRRDVAVQTKE